MAWTTPKTWSVGETLTAANFNTHIRDNQLVTPHVLAFKSADETVTTSAVLQNDDHLSFAIGANETWQVRLGLWATMSSTGHLQVSATVPASATWSLMIPWAVNGSSTEGIRRIDNSQLTDTLFLVSGANFVYEFTGMVATAGTAGTFQFQWAQSSAAGTTTIKKGSYMIGMKIV